MFQRREPEARSRGRPGCWTSPSVVGECGVGVGRWVVGRWDGGTVGRWVVGRWVVPQSHSPPVPQSHHSPTHLPTSIFFHNSTAESMSRTKLVKVKDRTILLMDFSGIVNVD